MTITTTPETAHTTVAGVPLHMRGTFDLDAPRVAIVGARASTSYGEHVAAELATDLAARGVVVVSGGAYGIDAAAHRGTLAAGGSTVAVMAAGLDRLYPAGNAALLATIPERGGALLTEYAPGTVPSRHRFLERNRVIARLATHGLIVVEAAARSGSMSAARAAAELGRPVYAVPGPLTSMTSDGPHALIKQGAARLLTDVADLTDLPA